KAMSKEIDRRYASCEELASDLRAWLRGEPTLARPITKRERLARWTRRNRGLAAAFGGTAFALLLAAGLGVTTAAIQTKARLDVTAAQATTAEALTAAETERDSAQKERDTARQERDRADKERQRAEEQTKLVAEQQKLAEERLEDAQTNAYVTTFRLAEARWRDGDGDKAVALLEQLRPKEGETDRRGWEWNFLWNRSHCDLAHIGPAELAALELKGYGTVQLPPAPDGNTVLYVAYDEIVVLDLATATAKLRIKTPNPETQYFVGRFSPDGRWIFAGSNRNELTCWDATTGAQRYSAKSPQTGRLADIDFSPDGKSLFTYATPLAEDGRSLVGLQVGVWNADDGASLSSFDVAAGSWGKQISPDGRSIVAGRNLWDSRTGAHLRRLELKQLDSDINRSSDAYCFSPDGRSVACLNELGLTVFDVETGKEQLVVPAARTGRIYSGKISYSPDGHRIATYSEDGIKVWNATSGELQLTIRAGSTAVAVAFSADGRSIIGAGRGDGTFNRWDAATGANDFQVELAWPHSAGLTQLSSADKELRVVSGSQGPMICDLASGETLLRCEPVLEESNSTFFLALSPDGRHVYGGELGANEQQVGADSQTFVAWDMATGKRDYTVPAPGLWLGHPSHTHMSADGRYLATVGMKAYAKSFWTPSNTVICDLANGSLGQENVGGAFAIDSTGDRVLNSAGLWDIRAKRHLLPLHPGRATTKDYMVTAAAFSQDGSLVAAANSSGTVRLYDVPSETSPQASNFTGKPRMRLDNVVNGQLPRVLREKVASVTKVAFSPDGRRLLTVTEAGTAQLWDLATNQELLTLTSESTDVAMSPDGSRIFCLSTNSPQGTPPSKFQCVVWDGRPESEWKTRAAERAARSTLAYFRGKTKSQDELIAAIKQDATINEDIRAMSVQFASMPPPKIIKLQQ
ncbi:MAG: PQQ-binding-like beta-propeller repeat protein, partial [Pirellulaceae bacterium]